MIPTEDTTLILAENIPQPLQEADAAFSFFSPMIYSDKKSLDIYVMDFC